MSFRTDHMIRLTLSTTVENGKMDDASQSIWESLSAGHNLFIYGSPGTGKTTQLLNIIKHIGRTKKVGVTATTGIAASHLPGGVTINR